MGRLVLNRPVGLESPELIIHAPDGKEIRIRAMPASGIDVVRLAIEAPQEYAIQREEAKCKQPTKEFRRVGGKTCAV